MGKDAVQGFYAKIPNAAATDSTKTRFVVPCDTQMTLMFTFAGHQFTLDPRDTVIRDASNTTKCYGVVRATDSPVFQLGVPFLRNVYT